MISTAQPSLLGNSQLNYDSDLTPMITSPPAEAAALNAASIVYSNHYIHCFLTIYLVHPITIRFTLKLLRRLEVKLRRFVRMKPCFNKSPMSLTRKPLASISQRAHSIFAHQEHSKSHYGKELSFLRKHDEKHKTVYK